MRASHLREDTASEISIMKQISDMLQRTSVCAMLVNEDGAVILWAKAAERLLGFLAQDVMGHSFLLGKCEHRPRARMEA
jgi:hypothetical protein